MGVAPMIPGGKINIAFSALSAAIESDDSANLNTYRKTVWNQNGTKTDGELYFTFSPNTGTVKNNGTEATYVYLKLYQKGSNSGRIRLSSNFDTATYTQAQMDAYSIEVSKTYKNNNTSKERWWEVILKVSPGAQISVLFEGSDYSSYLMEFKWLKQS